ncbi:MAG: TRAP transporter small permease [Deltaproteobacteria bacterium]|nr:TRAP transporter small permease [Deltaproteobacteria bacterium]
MKQFLDSVESRFGKLSKWLNWGAGGALVAMMFLVNANVFLRPFGRPIWGTFEIVGFLGTIVISFALIQTTFSRGHMAVEIVISRMPRRARIILGLINRLICLLMLALVAWQSVEYGLKVVKSGQVSATLKMPFYPFLYGIAFAFGVAALIVLVDILKAPFRVEEK